MKDEGRKGEREEMEGERDGRKRAMVSNERMRERDERREGTEKKGDREKRGGKGGVG